MNIIERYEQQLKVQYAPGNCSAIVPYDVLLEILQLAKIGQQMQWIPASEMLPESGVPVIAYAKDNYKRDIIIRAMYCAPFTEESHEDWVDDADYDEDKDLYFVKEGWYENNVYEDAHYSVDGKITHWMSLPNPPEDGDNNEHR